jgi:dihydropteroate synthase
MQQDINIMGILNLTPDSFYDGGKHFDPEQAVTHTRKMLEEGADIIDLGAYSSRPGATHISEKEEEKRLLPILKILLEEFPGTLFSIDTFRSRIAEKAIAAGAGIINDISGGEMDSNMFGIIAEMQVPYILMHMKGTPQNMQKKPAYNNVVQEIREYFIRKIEQLLLTGVKDIILDVGFGFGKTMEDNYILLYHMEEFTKLGHLLLAGISRKSMLYKPLGITPDEALHATGGAHMLALINGARYLRVHDVKQARQIVKIYNLYRQADISHKK